MRNRLTVLLLAVILPTAIGASGYFLLKKKFKAIETALANRVPQIVEAEFNRRTPPLVEAEFNRRTPPLVEAEITKLRLDSRLLQLVDEKFARARLDTEETAQLLNGKMVDHDLFFSRELALLSKKNAAARSGGFVVQHPKKNELFQHFQGKATIRFDVWRLASKETIEVTLKSKLHPEHSFSAQGESGEFKDVPTGVYDITFKSPHQTEIGAVAVGDVYLVAGQSNAVSPAQKHSPYYSETGRVWLSTYADEPVGEFRIPDKASPVTTSIAWLYAGDALAREVDYPIGFINVAKGNTTTLLWKPESDFLAKRIEEVLSEKKVKAVLWHQGESDSAHFYTTETTYANMKELIAFSRKLQSHLDWFVARSSVPTFHQREVGDPTRPTAEAQNKIIREKLAFPGPDTDILRATKPYIDEGLGEFIGKGLKAHGMLWYDALKAHYYSR